MKRATLLFAACLAPLAVRAQVFATSFESSEGYTLGNADGQNGWALTSGSGDAFLITNNRAHGGTQSVTSTYPVSNSSSTLLDLSHDVTVGTGTVTMSGFMWIDGNSFQTNRAFGMSLANGPTASSTVGGITIDGLGTIRFASDYAGMFSGTSFATGRLADSVNRWLGLSVSYNPGLTTNNMTWTLSGLGTSTGAATLTNTGTVDAPNPAISNVILFNEWTADFSNSNGTANWDDVNVSTVPEPASLAILGVGAMALLRRRRAKKA